MKKNIKVSKELFVGIRNNDAVGWAVAYNNTTKKGKKDQEKVKNWSGANGIAKVILNEPIDGFEIDKSVSRYSTSNKLWRIKDPRGFILEISTENMEMLLNNCTMDRGVVKGKCIWGSSSKMALIPETHPEFNDFLEQKKVSKIKYLAPSKFKKGMILRKNTGEKIKYLGKILYYGIHISHRELNGTKYGWRNYEYYINELDKPKTVHLYEDLNGSVYYGSKYIFQKTLKASLIEEGEEGTPINQAFIDGMIVDGTCGCNGNFHTYAYFLTVDPVECCINPANDKQVIDDQGNLLYETKAR